MSRETLFAAVRDEPWDPESRRVDALVSRLRRKLECDLCGVEGALTTVHGRGYRFADAQRVVLVEGVEPLQR